MVWTTCKAFYVQYLTSNRFYFATNVFCAFFRGVFRTFTVSFEKLVPFWSDQESSCRTLKLRLYSVSKIFVWRCCPLCV